MTVTPWAYEAAYRSAAQALANAIFDELDPTLRPRVFLVVLNVGADGQLRAQGLESTGTTLPGDFLLKVAERAAVLRTTVPDRTTSWTAATQGASRRLPGMEAWRQAVQDALGALENATEVVSFVGDPRAVDAAVVLTVLQLARRAWEACYSLRRSAADVRARRPTSILDAAVAEMLRRCAATLTEASETEGPPSLDHDPEEILATAGRLLTDTPALGEGADLHLRGLFQACNTLASLNYEGQGTVGRIILSRPGYPGLQHRVSLTNPIRLHDLPAVRKLLVTSGSGMALLSDGAVVFGLGGLDMNRSLTGESMFHIAFLKASTWELSRGLRPLMRVTYGRPRMPRLSISEARFRFYMTRTFGLVPMEDFERVWALALAASEQRHGTILVISTGAEEEARRLAQQGLSVSPVKLDRDSLLAVSSIDGAVLIGPDTTCHAIGVILDGRAQGTGDPARGARYNSALRYVLSSEKPCLAVVVSEDGRVDILCR
jgi:hypothetical protein